jgi:MFS superfamily sulfate permease-like transporter
MCGSIIATTSQFRATDILLVLLMLAVLWAWWWLVDRLEDYILRLGSKSRDSARTEHQTLVVSCTVLPPEREKL